MCVCACHGSRQHQPTSGCQVVRREQRQFWKTGKRPRDLTSICSPDSWEPLLETPFFFYLDTQAGDRTGEKPRISPPPPPRMSEEASRYFLQESAQVQSRFSNLSEVLLLRNCDHRATTRPPTTIWTKFRCFDPSAILNVPRLVCLPPENPPPGQMSRCRGYCLFPTL